MREIAIDTETTGLDPYSGHRMVEIACVEMQGHIRTGQVFHTYLNPEREVPKEAEAIHGISNAMLHDKPLFSKIAGAFLEFIGDSSLIIHNAAFDMKFINAELESAGLSTIPMTRATDTVLMARKKYPGQPASLDALCRRFNIDLSARTKHGALLDAELLCEVYLEMMGGRQQGLGFANAASQDITEEAAMIFSGHADLPVRQFLPSSEELAAHAVMLTKIKEPLWAEDA